MSELKRCPLCGDTLWLSKCSDGYDNFQFSYFCNNEGCVFECSERSCKEELDRLANRRRMPDEVRKVVAEATDAMAHIFYSDFEAYLRLRNSIDAMKRYYGEE